MSEKKKRSDEPTYSAASAELERILQEIESGEADLDELTEKVERAAALLAFCRQKLAATETKVRKATAELQAALQVDGDESNDEAEDEGDHDGSSGGEAEPGATQRGPAGDEEDA